MWLWGGMDLGRVISSLVRQTFNLSFTLFDAHIAIRFVLSDAYTSMSREERQALLHEGVSVTTTLSAYGKLIHVSRMAQNSLQCPAVEIVFDNSDSFYIPLYPTIPIYSCTLSDRKARSNIESSERSFFRSDGDQSQDWKMGRRVGAARRRAII